MAKLSWGTLTGYPFFITQTTDSGFVIIGQTSSYNGDVSNNHSWQGGSWRDIWIIKLTPNGEVEWEQCYDGAENEMFWGTHAIVKKGDYNYVFNVQARMNLGDVQCELNGDIDAWVFEIDIEDTMGIYENIVMQDNLRVYPNPAGAYVVFSSYANASEDMGKIMVFDVFGREVLRREIALENTYRPSPGHRRRRIDLREVGNRIYLYRFEVDGYHYSGKFVVRR